jgi:hypothetical protein
MDEQPPFQPNRPAVRAFRLWVKRLADFTQHAPGDDLVHLVKRLLLARWFGEIS